ncbi:nonsense-mediated mRNA decay factor SMG8-like [Paramacrobiotus metropolitanus]|uniref:nonsense-mediated mRNA decay factor SMG8-like n=1 Tax=Paramacrobiotus metropolitanus TaxID=2943436 RepID=UPI002445A16B|nr:nonsense-mediated mRNA decay factor SMG8-like [Paramacrobiotus metropolitanus]XP_055334378.1 nonsense-mediated mRNA decay factor SMG8-like [Paramacrobiotus metropolitanus]XP_055334386.1 nonsense-mediated mRNA decay factor SMG8-like [Paramacrobiotus metropolitanus]
MDASDSSLEWIRIDIGNQDVDSLDLLMKFVAKYSSVRPAFIALIGSLSDSVTLEERPDIEAILNNTLPCYVLNRRSADIDYIPSCVASVYNRLGTDVFYVRISGRNVNVLQNPERRDFSTDEDPPDEIELDLAESDSEYSRLLLLIFTMSHIVLWFHSDIVFSNYDLRLLKIVDLARLKGLPLVSKMLAQITENKDWVREGCLCCPRLIFIFSGSPSFLDPNSLPHEKNYLELKAEQDASVRLYTVLKKCRLISIPRSSGLCFLSAKKETVVFVRERATPSQFLNVLPNVKDFGSKNSEADDSTEFFIPPVNNVKDKDQPNVPLRLGTQSFASSFDGMLQTCISDITQASVVSATSRPSGFAWPSHFYKPSLSEWFAAALQFHSLLFHSEEFRTLLDSRLGCTMSISRKYSKSVAVFSVNSFSLRLMDSSIRQIRNCLHSYMQFARGPAAKGFGGALTSYLTAGSRNRRQCPVRSLFGSRCSLTVHLTPQQSARLGKDPRKQRLPVVYHQSRVSLMSFCSCGRTAQQRPEPFNVREANELFYETMAYKCCSLLDRRIDFPSSSLNRKDRKAKEDKKPEVMTIKRFDSFPDLSTAAQFNEKEISQPFVSVVVPAEPESTTNRATIRPYMFQLGMSYDLTPRISSWVLYGLGSASRYRHAHGLEHHLQADFLNLHHHLIAVDTEILLDHRHKFIRHLPNRPTHTQIVEPATTWHSKIYFGLDFECPKGHRFMYKSREIFDLYAEGKTDVAQNLAENILRNGAPLFMRCHCKDAKENRQFIAQLMRIHVITPRDVLQIGFLPKVKISRGIPAFHPGIEHPLILDANM